MSPEAMAETTSGASPRSRARIAGVFYLLVFVIGSLALVLVNGRVAVNLVAAACYVVVVLLFAGLFEPVSRRISRLAAFVGLLGCAASAVNSFRPALLRINPLAIFGVYCLLIGYLIYRSLFLPRILGVLMAIAGLGWLTFASPSLGRSLAPMNMLPGVIGEGALTLWLLVKGVNAERWKEQAREVSR
jgi:uncharacterized protein DUF4386